jgi:hypothetical protein
MYPRRVANLKACLGLLFVLLDASRTNAQRMEARNARKLAKITICARFGLDFLSGSIALSKT